MKIDKTKNFFIDGDNENENSYGNVVLRSVGVFDVSKLDELYSKSDLFSKEFSSFFQTRDNGLSYRESLAFNAQGVPTVVEFFVSVKGDNPDWFEKNKDFLMKGSLGKAVAVAEKMGSLAQEKVGYSIRQLKSWDEEKLAKWSIFTRNALNEDWIKTNNDYVKSLDNLIEKEYQKMKEAADVGYRLGLVKAVNLGLDFSFDDNYVLKKLTEKNNNKLIEEFHL